MIKGLYTAWSGMRNEQNRMDVVANNLANVNTTGFKKEGSVSQPFSDVLGLKIKDRSEAPFTTRQIGTLNLGVKLGETYVDWSQGPFRVTDETFDFALSGNGFFMIEYTNKAENIRRDEANQTNVMYTRDGNFTLRQDGTLVTQEGDYVLDPQGNHIVLDPLDTSTSVNSQGQIWQSGAVVGQIGLADFEDYDTLWRYGENFFEPTEDAVQIPATAQVYQGYLEQSNVSTVDEMVNMIAVQRQYEANSTMIQSVNTTLETAVSQVGRLA
ncbi:MAG: flagellar basal-body rod protein FlgF [Lachnospiraceae bacterium]|nr:flagellar basal-body rod protein FlgF [Lachnospiraceae bacterium]